MTSLIVSEILTIKLMMMILQNGIIQNIADLGKRFGQMEHFMKEIILMVKCKEKASFNGPMVVHMMENLRTTTFMETARYFIFSLNRNLLMG